MSNPTVLIYDPSTDLVIRSVEINGNKADIQWGELDSLNSFVWYDYINVEEIADTLLGMMVRKGTEDSKGDIIKAAPYKTSAIMGWVFVGVRQLNDCEWSIDWADSFKLGDV